MTRAPAGAAAGPSGTSVDPYSCGGKPTVASTLRLCVGLATRAPSVATAGTDDERALAAPTTARTQVIGWPSARGSSHHRLGPRSAVVGAEGENVQGAALARVIASCEQDSARRVGMGDHTSSASVRAGAKPLGTICDPVRVLFTRRASTVPTDARAGSVRLGTRRTEGVGGFLGIRGRLASADPNAPYGTESSPRLRLIDTPVGAGPKDAGTARARTARNWRPPARGCPSVSCPGVP